MGEKPVQAAFEDDTAIVAQQYTQWAYPAPIPDLNELISNGVRYALDVEVCAPTFWPRCPNKSNLKILVAGCGTNQAAYYAYRNPTARVVGIDLSETSLAHEKYLKEKHGLKNLHLMRGSLLDVSVLDERFDLVFCTGVLHHLSDPSLGLNALKAVLKPDGLMGIMLYGKSLRSGVYVMQEAFQNLGLKQSAEDVSLVRATLDLLPANHTVQPYLEVAHDLKDDAGVVDTFLHPVDRAYSVSEVLDFVRANGLEYVRWSQPAKYDPQSSLPANHPILPKLLSLPIEQQWHVLDLLVQKNGLHELIIAFPDYVQEIKIEFSSDEYKKYTPRPSLGLKVLEPAAVVEGVLSAVLQLEDLTFRIRGTSVLIALAVDTQKTILQIVDELSQKRPEIKWEDEAREFFDRMYRIGAFSFLIV
ncbi:MAG: hypothetical protein RIR18_1057 [Pseudomonadota bacterium]|jgi:SAM-dependent methyltransferase